MEQTTTTRRRRRSDGERSRRAILDVAMRLATVEGLDGLTIGRLASRTGMSKSGLFAHFGSKEGLQLATVEAAEEVFRELVVDPALAQPDGLARVRALCERFMGHVEDDVFPGGCFFASAGAELDTRPGPVRDRVAAIHRDWSGLIRAALSAARDAGEIAPDADPDQLAFEIKAMLAEANAVYLLQDEPRAFAMARRAIDDRLARAAGSG